MPFIWYLSFPLEKEFPKDNSLADLFVSAGNLIIFINNMPQNRTEASIWAPFTFYHLKMEYQVLLPLKKTLVMNTKGNLLHLCREGFQKPSRLRATSVDRDCHRRPHTNTERQALAPRAIGLDAVLTIPSLP